MLGLILYGPPAAGKDTVTAALHEIDERYALFPRLKAGSGRTSGYRVTTTAAIDNLRGQGEIVWENHRYGAHYVIDKPSLLYRLANHVPVLHAGQTEVVDAVKSATPSAHWLVVYIWCPRDVAAARIAARATGDTEARLRAWDETTPIQADVRINTAEVPAVEAAQEIHYRALQLGHGVTST